MGGYIYIYIFASKSQIISSNVHASWPLGIEMAIGLISIYEYCHNFSHFQKWVKQTKLVKQK